MDMIKPLQLLPRSIVEKSLLGFELARSVTFLSQNLLLLAFNEQARARKPEFGPQFRQILKDLTILIKKDVENISAGVYPIDVLKTEPAKDFFLRTPQILFDSFSISKRRLQHRSHD